tara:strand:- start:1650 stop:2027 length:378 start_codon:yes stop_codon:yes gene_type:complete
MQPKKEQEQERLTELVDDICDTLGIETHQARMAAMVALENLMLFDKKQQDYGPYNICGNPNPLLGVAFRAGDKVNRLMNLLLNSDGRVNNESIDDSCKDLANYGLIAQILLRKCWLSPEEQDRTT